MQSLSNQIQPIAIKDRTYTILIENSVTYHKENKTFVPHQHIFSKWYASCFCQGHHVNEADAIALTTKEGG